MMSKSIYRIMYAISMVFTIFCFVSHAFAQPQISMNQIPKKIPLEVKEQIEKLYSEKAVPRAKAAMELGRMKELARAVNKYLK